MKKIIIFFLIFGSSVINTKAEIAYIDINLILNSSDVGKHLNKYIEEIKKKNIDRFKLIENDLLKKEKALIAQQNILEKSEFEKKLNALSSEVQKYRADKKTSTEEIKKIKIENTKKILKILNPIITKYVDLNSISIVIPKKNIIVGKKNLDITNKIILLLNENIKKLDF